MFGGDVCGCSGRSVVEALKTECKINGIKYIRLDTGLDKKVVRKIYLNAGFKIVDIIDYDNGNSMALVNFKRLLRKLM